MAWQRAFVKDGPRFRYEKLVLWKIQSKNIALGILRSESSNDDGTGGLISEIIG